MPTAGRAGDVSYTVDRLLRLLPGDLAVGGKIDSGPAGLVRLSGPVAAVLAGERTGGDIAVIAAAAGPGQSSTAAGLRVILTSWRKPYHVLSDFAALGLDVMAADLVMVTIGYLEPEPYQAAADWLLALTPGGVDQDLRLGHRNLSRPVFPSDDPADPPALTPQIL